MSDLATEIKDYLGWLMRQGVGLCWLGSDWNEMLDGDEAERLLKKWLGQKEAKP